MRRFGQCSQTNNSKKAETNTQTSKSAHALLLIAGIAAILFSTVAMSFVPVAGWFRSSLKGAHGDFSWGRFLEMPAKSLALTPPNARAARSRGRCDVCGVVDSMRRIPAEGNTPEIYEITVRLADGSTRVLSEASTTHWRLGQHIVLIGGENS